MKDKRLPDYFFYCVNCGHTYGYLEFISKKSEKKEIDCPKCGSKRFKRCYGNLFGKPILPTRFMNKRSEK